ncbi:MAG TPA: tetratricopeptide repeat protein, partial [Luteimonas sp.]|nr:tetratricopeptide repeat protein [Luteimonas sp.]
MSSIARNALRVALLGGALLTASTSMAQQSGASERAAERRARAAGTNTGDAKATRQEPVYPEATRKEPGIKASAKGGPRLQKLFAAYDKDDLAAVQPLADEFISSASANAYEKAIAARIVGSMLMGSDDARALAYMQQAVSFNGLSNNEHFETMLVAAQLQLQAEQYPAALTTLDAFLAETGSRKPEHLVYKANALFQLQRYPEAIALLKPIIDAGEARPEWTQLLMAAYSEAGQPTEAAALAEQIANKTPSDKRAQVNLAGTYLQGEQYDKAAAVYERLRAAGQLTEDRDYRNLFSLYLSSEGKERQAIEFLMDRTARVVGAEAQVVREQFRRNRVGLLFGEASFIDPHTICIKDEDDGIKSVSAENIVIATGTRPNRPSQVEFDDERVLDSDSVLQIKQVPNSMVVVGAG